MEDHMTTEQLDLLIKLRDDGKMLNGQKSSWERLERHFGLPPM
jgi:hypothetical protein